MREKLVEKIEEYIGAGELVAAHADAIIHRQKNIKGDFDSRQYELPGIPEPLRFRISKLLEDDEGNFVFQVNAVLSFKQAQARELRKSMNKATAAHNIAAVETELFAAWTLKQVLAGIKNPAELTFGKFLESEGLWEASPPPPIPLRPIATSPEP